MFRRYVHNAALRQNKSILQLSWSVSDIPVNYQRNLDLFKFHFVLYGIDSPNI